MKNESFVIERLLNATVKKVWEAITQKDQMKIWYFDLEKFEPKVGFEFSFMGGPPEKEYLHLCKITEVIEFRKIAYTWRYDGYEGNSEVSFELFPEGEKTRIKLTHSGLETFPPIADLARSNFEAGWTALIGDLLKDFVELFDRQITSRRWFKFSPDQLWEAWSNPNLLKSWWGPKGFTNTFHQFDFQTGGKWEFTMHSPDGVDFLNHHVFVEIDPKKKLVFDHIEPVHKFRVTATLDQNGHQTFLTFKMTFDDVAECQRVKKFIEEANEQNFDRLEETLKSI